MRYLLDLVYLALLLVALPWLLWQAARTGKYREGWREKFFGLVPRRTSRRPCVWFHAVSVGEVNLLAPLVRAFQAKHPGWDIAISTTTRTGHVLAGSRYPDATRFYCPFDFTWSTRAALRRIRPDLLILAELELWPNLITAARRSGARVAIVNGRLSDRSHRGYRRLRWLLAPVLRQIDLIAAQNEQYAGHFRALGARQPAVAVTGSVKFDGAQTDRQNPKTTALAALAGFHLDDVILMAGSTSDSEEAIALRTFLALAPSYPRLRLVIVPRHPERFAAVAQLLHESGQPWQRRSELERQGADRQARILLVDRIGELGGWWGAAQIAFVGGSFCDRGGQNMIEPAAYGAAVCFGPNTRNFREIVAMLRERQAAVSLANEEELTHFVRRCLEDPSFAADLGARARQLVISQVGATQRTLELLGQLMPPQSRAVGRIRPAA